MTPEIRRIERVEYTLYESIPNSFVVESILHVEPVADGLGGLLLREEPVAKTYVKDYEMEGRDNPTAWANEFDLRQWGIFLAMNGTTPVGGAAVAVEAPLYPLDRFQRPDLVVLWDLRVHPDHRRRGVGRSLFEHSARWARQVGYGQLGLETQNTNVPACRFYQRLGCQLGAVHRYGYAGCPDVADEAMLLWYFDLEGAGADR